MSYTDQSRRNRPATIAAVAIIHAGLGYAIISGLAYQVVKFVPTVTPTDVYEDPADPPKRELPPPPPARRDLPTQAPDKRIVVVPADTLTDTIDLRTIDPPRKPDLDVTPPPPPRDPPKANLTRSAEPGAGRSGWVTSDDYPARELREGVTGSVGIAVAIGTDGHVQSCEVTKSSGNANLDEATCRIYARRARFKPALDGEGKAVVSRFADRIRWELPQ
jgi:protein TonB